ncbi:DUF3139 domain-containing protein [Viridibacillus sp. FSL R5-0477]|uniref:DUF3139 domain-containing protein n=1 Tax=Viridibacillus arenosi FSL R5-213 TaxID=1227360 RepID=W4EM22_9BACL|nr:MULTISPECIES: DUF3139 domain-containing protein [Viridibacillus]ETT81057.1 hypothetical protein C176_20164 [Viridibacillus arenosi FSL R5-213]OMC84010.1 hypothetical protein BK130_05780 [Viridibacillus sp. FSL H8-0123]OMC88533.1 hypothetical protein BK128_00905 [Viridibacillus sp. FSL H7-0596]OMC93168.1 hypothetical protein BK137_01210 [Viridibacillus arenosi]
MRKIKKIIAIVLLVLILVSALKIQNIRTTYEERVNSYLLNEQGYEKKEIKSIKTKYNFKMPPFYTIVIFEDEPFVKYCYFAHNEGRVKQFDYILTEEAKKIDIDESKLKHYVPYE